MPLERLILLVDDDADTRGLLQDLLVREGFEVQTACDGAEAIDRLRSEHPHAVVTDLMMPGVNGHALVDYMQQSDRLADVPIAVVSGHAHLAPPGCQAFPKPLEFAKLLRFLSAPTITAT